MLTIQRQDVISFRLVAPCRNMSGFAICHMSHHIPLKQHTNLWITINFNLAMVMFKTLMKSHHHHLHHQASRCITKLGSQTEAPLRGTWHENIIPTELDMVCETVKHQDALYCQKGEVAFNLQKRTPTKFKALFVFGFLKSLIRILSMVPSEEGEHRCCFVSSWFHKQCVYTCFGRGNVTCKKGRQFCWGNWMLG